MSEELNSPKPQNLPLPPYQGSYPNPTYYAYRPRPKTVFSPAEQLLALFSLLLGYAFVRLVLWVNPGFGVTLFCVAFLAVALLFYRKKATAVSKSSYLLLGFCGLFAVPFTLFSDKTVLIPCFLFWTLLACLWVSAVNGTKIRNLFTDGIHALFTVPLGSYGRGFPALGQLLKRLPAQKSLLRVLLGLLVALPITSIVVLLLMSADDIFTNMVKDVGENLSWLLFQNVLETVFQFICTVPVFLYIFGLLDGSFRKPECRRPVYGANPAAPHRIPPLTACVAATPILLVYIAFFCAQLPYYFAAFHAYLPAEYTVAAFARKGFFELCAVACINFVILLVLQLLTARRDNEKTALSVRIYSTLIALFTMLLIATALRKMLLYISCFGLTKLRVFTCWFMLLLSGLFICIMLYQFFSRLPLQSCIAVISVLFMTLACFGNFDGIITRYNVAHYQNGELEEFDVEHLYSLSADAVPYVLPLLEDDDPMLQKRIRNYLRYQKQELEERTFPSYSVSTYRALKAIEKATKQ